MADPAPYRKTIHKAEPPLLMALAARERASSPRREATVTFTWREASMMTPQESLTRDLREYLINEFSSAPRPRRERSCWVMNIEWLNECRKIESHLYDGSIGHPEIMLGLPVYVTEDGGFPHLIAD
jgi:hypothetical protein